MKNHHVSSILASTLISLVIILEFHAVYAAIPNPWSASWDFLQHMSPLVQFQGGISAKNVHCENNYTLLIKTENGFPACVTPSSVNRLEKQGWILANSKESDQYYKDLIKPISEKIIPGPKPKSCDAIHHIPSYVINSTGFLVYNYSGINDYVVSTGQKGTLTYKIDASGQLNLTASSFRDDFSQSILNDIAFYSQDNFTVKQTVVSKIISFPNGTMLNGYNACYFLPFPYLSACHGGPGPIPLNITSILVPGYDPPMGVNMMSVPRSEDVQIGNAYTVSTTITVSTDAKQGTYWIALPPGVCRGGSLALVTIGDKSLMPEAYLDK